MSIPSASGSQPAGCSDFANRSTPVRMPRMDDIEIERLLTSGTHAELLIGHAQAFVGKGDWLDIEAITLVSPPDAWPCTIRMEYSIDGVHHVDESEWDGITGQESPDWDVLSTWGEADMFMGIWSAHLDEALNAKR